MMRSEKLVFGWLWSLDACMGNDLSIETIGPVLFMQKPRVCAFWHVHHGPCSWLQYCILACLGFHFIDNLPSALWDTLFLFDCVWGYSDGWVWCIFTLYKQHAHCILVTAVHGSWLNHEEALWRLYCVRFILMLHLIVCWICGLGLIVDTGLVSMWCRVDLTHSRSSPRTSRTETWQMTKTKVYVMIVHLHHFLLSLLWSVWHLGMLGMCFGGSISAEWPACMKLVILLAALFHSCLVPAVLYWASSYRMKHHVCDPPQNGPNTMLIQDCL